MAHHLPRLVIAGLFLLPAVWLLSASLREPGLPPPLTVEWLPSPVAWSNYRAIFELAPLAAYAGNSLLVVLLATPLTIVTASWAGFAMTQMPRRVRNALIVASVMLLVVPTVSLWLPRLVIFKQLGLIDTRWALIAPAITGSSPLFILLYYWTFRRLPSAIFESARLDGANLLQIWAMVAMPLARPTTAAVGLLACAMYWSDFVSPLLYLKSERLYTLPIGLQSLQQMDVIDRPLLMAGAVIMTLPILLLFAACQRFLWPERHGL
ncbi:MAG: carbohydrate ABC transporter permease [Hyphomicrobiales bacterium]|nr:carbohydrate ABC transporter permease [Hyphomicrobiales bacterium]